MSLKVERHVNTWTDNRKNQSCNIKYLEWVAAVLEYINAVYIETKVPPNAKNRLMRPLTSVIPIIGPIFIPPSYIHLRIRDPTCFVTPDIAYLKVLHVVHPFYYPNIGRCPYCTSTNVRWDSWTATGPREVHGVDREECAIGYQLRCNSCFKEREERKKSGEADGEPQEAAPDQYCTTTTSVDFWKPYDFWQIPGA